MAIIKKACPYCNKVTDLISEAVYGDLILRTFKCGHSTTETKAKELDRESIESFKALDGKKLFPYQVDGVKLIFSSNGRALIADEMGLGKTAQALVPLALQPDEFLPAILVCKSVAKANHFRETVNFGHTIAQVIEETNSPWVDLFKVHIISYDLLNRIMNDKNRKGKRIRHLDFEAIRLRARTIIIDETHLIKNPDTQRSKSVKLLCGGEDIVIDETSILTFPAVPHIIGLSGTPIKNNASEFFTILNILYPEKFWRFNRFCQSHVQTVWDGYGWKYGGLRDPERFNDMTKEYFIRRTMDEVMPQLPKLWRHPSFADLEGEVAEIYNKEQEEFADYFEDGRGDSDYQANILAKMARLRHITSLAKIDLCIDKACEFLGSTDRKLAIFTHHLDTRDILAERLNKVLEELKLGQVVILAAKDKSQIEVEIAKFKDGPDRVLMLSTLAHGESLNLQFLSDSILHERQWNPANEDQAISGRFRRLGQEAKAINCHILIAVGTIDEYFAELVEKKREYVDASLNGGEAQPWDTSSLMMELASIIAEKGKRKWKIA